MALSLFFLVPVMESSSPWTGLYRSFALVRNGQWFRTAATLLAILVGWFVGQAVLSVLLAPLTLLIGTDDPWSTDSLLVNAIFHWVLAVVLVPLLIACLVMLYNDLQLREGQAAPPVGPSGSGSGGGALDA